MYISAFAKQIILHRVFLLILVLICHCFRYLEKSLLEANVTLEPEMLDFMHGLADITDKSSVEAMFDSFPWLSTDCRVVSLATSTILWLPTSSVASLFPVTSEIFPSSEAAAPKLFNNTAVFRTVAPAPFAAVPESDPRGFQWIWFVILPMVAVSVLGIVFVCSRRHSLRLRHAPLNVGNTNP